MSSELVLGLDYSKTDRYNQHLSQPVQYYTDAVLHDGPLHDSKKAFIFMAFYPSKQSEL